MFWKLPFTVPIGTSPFTVTVPHRHSRLDIAEECRATMNSYKKLSVTVDGRVRLYQCLTTEYLDLLPIFCSPSMAS